MSKDAEISIGADASAVKEAAGMVKTAWKDAGKNITEHMGEAARSVAMDAANIALSFGKINLAQQHSQVRDFENSTAHLAVATGQCLESVRAGFEETGKAIGKRPQEVAAWSTEVGKLTYNFRGAAEGIKGMSALAAETGRSVDDYKGLAVTLATVGSVTGDTTHALGVMQAQADAVNTSGGIAAFADQVEGLRETISHFAIKSEADFLKVTAAASALGKGLSPAAAGRVQQSALGAVAADPLRWERYLGHGIMDDHGQVEDPTKVLKEITEKTKNRYGKDARRVLMLNFGAETGAAMYGANYDEAAKAAGMAPKQTAAEKQAEYLKTDAGKREVAEATLAESSRALMGSSTKLGQAADAMQQFAAHNPLTATLVATALGTGMSSAMSGLTKILSTLAGAPKVGGLGGLGKMGGVVGAGLAGLVVGAETGEYLADNYGDEIDQATGDPYGTQSKKRELADATANLNRAKYFRDAKKGITASAGIWESLGIEGAPGTGVQKLDATGIEKAITDGLKNWKPVIQNSSGGPVEVAGAASQSSAAGGQGG